MAIASKLAPAWGHQVPDIALLAPFASFPLPTSFEQPTNPLFFMIFS
ncbi:hypothetical protein [Pseudomonas sp.]